MGRSARSRLLFLAAVLAFAALSPQPAQAASMPFLWSCPPRTDQPDSFSYRFCSGYVASFDGVQLDTDLTMPAGTTPSGGYPLVVMMHGWGGSKSYWETNDFCTTTSADACNYNNIWFAHRGYAVVTYTARGFHASQGYTHLADIRYEAHDTQYLGGLLADASVAMPGIGVTGLSYGGGQAWLLAVLANQVMNPDGTLTSWRSPGGTPLHIAAAVPKYTWSDLVDALQGWTDSLSPESQAAPMIEKPGPAAPSWPAYMYASDLGHPLADNNKFSEWRVINRAATAFFDLHVRHSGGADPAAAYQEQIVRCDSRAGQVYASATASGASPGRVPFKSSELGHATVSAPTDPAAGVATDPIAFAAQHSSNGGCVRLNPAPPDTGASTSWTFPICADFTLLGEPALHLDATLLGTDAGINSRLWDIAPDGSATLVTRGAYRWTVSTDAASMTYALLGNGWKFVAGHQLRIQVTQNDMPYLRLDNYQSSAVYSSMLLTLPTTASIGC